MIVSIFRSSIKRSNDAALYDALPVVDKRTSEDPAHRTDYFFLPTRTQRPLTQSCSQEQQDVREQQRGNRFEQHIPVSRQQCELVSELHHEGLHWP